MGNKSHLAINNTSEIAILAPQPTKAMRAAPNMPAMMAHGGLPVRFKDQTFIFSKSEGEKEVHISRHGFNTATVLGAFGISVSKTIAAARYYCRSKPDAKPADVYRAIDLSEWMAEEIVQQYCIDRRDRDDFEEAGWEIVERVIVKPRPELQQWFKTARAEAARIISEIHGTTRLTQASVKPAKVDKLTVAIREIYQQNQIEATDKKNGYEFVCRALDKRADKNPEELGPPSSWGHRSWQTCLGFTRDKVKKRIQREREKSGHIGTLSRT